MIGLSTQNRIAIRTQILACLLFLSASSLIGVTSSAQAGHWMYRRSYYSHQMSPEVESRYPRPLSRTAYRPTFMRSGPGYTVRGGYRIKRLYLRSGNSTDTTIFREDWFDVRP